MNLAHHNKYNKVVPTQIILEIQLSIVFKKKFPKMWLFMCNGWGLKVNETPVIWKKIGNISLSEIRHLRETFPNISHHFTGAIPPSKIISGKLRRMRYHIFLNHSARRRRVNNARGYDGPGGIFNWPLRLTRHQNLIKIYSCPLRTNDRRHSPFIYSFGQLTDYRVLSSFVGEIIFNLNRTYVCHSTKVVWGLFFLSMKNKLIKVHLYTFYLVNEYVYPKYYLKSSSPNQLFW